MKSTCGLRAMLSHFTIFGQSRAVLFIKTWEINAVMKKDSNCVGILSNQGEAATASNLK